MHHPEDGAAPRKRRIRLNITTLVFASLGALGLLAVVKFGWEALQSSQAYSRAHEQREFSAAADLFIKGTYEILLERLATDNALQAAGPADAAATTEIEAHRKVIRETYDPALAMIVQRNFTNKDALLDDLKEKLSKADSIRRRADSEIRLARNQRNEILRKTFAPTITDMVNASLGLWYAAVYSTAQGDSALTKLAVIKEIGWKMREFSGLSRAAVAGAIAAGTSIPADRLVVMTDNRSRVNALWMVLQNLTKDPQTHPAILAAMRQAQDKYFNGFLPLAEDMRKAGDAGTYPIAATQWVATTNPQIDALLAVMHAAGTASDARTQAQIDTASDHLLFNLGGLLACITIVLACAGIVVRQVTRPLTALAGAMRELADGHFDIVLPGLGLANEVGDMAAAMELFKIKAVERARVEAADRDAERQAVRDEQVEKIDGAIEAFRSSLEHMLQSVTDNAQDMNATAQTINGVSTAASQQATAAKEATERASGNVQTVASATEELSASIQEIGRQVGRAAEVVRDAGAKTEKSVGEIDGLAAMSERIGEVVNLIQAIAGQTNLLALNATIEAARAGEAGKGFAVVAQEVKSLAAQTAKATTEISQQIGAIQTSTNTAVGAVREVGAAVRDVNQVTATIAAAVEQQRSATQDISRNAQLAADGNATLVTNIAAVDEAITKANRSASLVLTASDRLTGEAGALANEVAQFFLTLRTGVLDRRKHQDPNYMGPERRKATLVKSA